MFFLKLFTCYKVQNSCCFAQIKMYIPMSKERLVYAVSALDPP